MLTIKMNDFNFFIKNGAKSAARDINRENAT